jgi:hypothetical protein
MGWHVRGAALKTIWLRLHEAHRCCVISIAAA